MKFKVYIIESPGSMDFLDGRTEGSALSASLRLARIENQLFTVINRAALLDCFDRVRNDIIEIRKNAISNMANGSHVSNELVQITLHFSCHGNTKGIGLTSGEFISWSELKDILLKLGKESGHFDETRRYCPFNLALSTCHGGHASEMLSGAEHPCTVVVGPTVEVDWADALIGFTTFYHNFAFKGHHGGDAVQRMNIAAGLDNVFVSTVSDNLALP